MGEIIEGVDAYFALGDVFVMPGIGGLALNQAMALGKPVVATVSDGTHEDLVVSGENGFIAREGDPAHLAECIARVLADPETTRLMGERSLAILLARATLQNMVDRFSEAIRAGLRGVSA